MTLPKLALIPSGYKGGTNPTVYSILPNNGDGDFTFSRSGNATRVNKNGLIETVGSNVPRLDYSDSSCPSLLLEPQRTNLITQSETLTTASLANTTISDNTEILDPKGGFNSKTLTATNATQPRLEWRLTPVPATDTTYSISVFVRYNTARYVGIWHYSKASEYTIFDLLNGTIETDVGTQTAIIKDYGNGWFRISKSFEVQTTETFNFFKLNLCTKTQIEIGVLNESVDLFGLQLEEGSYPTSYIPTEGTAETRTVDKCLNSGDANLFNDSEGTLFVDLENFDATSPRITLSNGFASNRIIFFFYGSSSGSPNKIRFYLERESQVQVDSLYNITYTFNQRNKIAFRYKQNDFKAYINGVEVFSDTIGNTPNNLSRLDFSQENQSSNFIEGKINDTRYYNTALTDAELQALTTL
jgi:hypothetical protein